jgi:hypothetical protein
VEKLLERLTSPLSTNTSAYSVIGNAMPLMPVAGRSGVGKDTNVVQSSVFATVSTTPLFDYNVCNSED